MGLGKGEEDDTRRVVRSVESTIDLAFHSGWTFLSQVWTLGVTSRLGSSEKDLSSAKVKAALHSLLERQTDMSRKKPERS